MRGRCGAPIQREIEDVLAEKMLFGEVGPGQIVLVGVEGEGPTAPFTFEGQKVGELPRPAAVRDRRGRAGRRSVGDEPGPTDDPRVDRCREATGSGAA